LSLAYLAQCGDLLFHPFFCKWHTIWNTFDTHSSTCMYNIQLWNNTNMEDETSLVTYECHTHL
jgi:hypothetical protein